MPCPTCNQTMQGIGHGAARAIVEQLLRWTKTEKQGDPISTVHRLAAIATMELIIERLADENARDFVCPNCGTVRTVTRTVCPVQGCYKGQVNVLPSYYESCANCAGTGYVEHNSDQPPRLVERVKAADDTKVVLCIMCRDGNRVEGVRAGSWADVRRCIGREKP